MAEVISPGASRSSGNFPAISEAPPAMPTIQTDASSPYAQSEPRLTCAKNTSATLSMAANRMMAPKMTKAATRTTSRRTMPTPARASCPSPSSLDPWGCRRAFNTKAARAITRKVSASNVMAALGPVDVPQ